MLESKQITLGFSLIIVTVFCLGLNFQWQLSKLFQDNNDLYEHPFAVSNAANNINFHLVSMHRYMKDVVLSMNDQELMLAVKLVNLNSA